MPRPGAATGRPETGFSLVELLVAMAIFSVLGVALVTLLAQSTAFLEQGQAGAESQDVMESAERLFDGDLANVYIQPSSREGEPDVRFLADHLPFDTDGDGLPDLLSPRLVFVRSLAGELTDRVLREAGSQPGAVGRVDGEDDEREAEEGMLRAPGGKAEVMYVYLPGRIDPETGEGEIGVGTLYRGERTPPGGRDSFLPWEAFRPTKRADDAARMGVATREQIQSRLRPVLEGVLYVDFRWWSRHTVEKAARLVVNDEIADVRDPRIGGGGLSATWDSTRAILPVGTRPDQFFMAKGADSLGDPFDDVFPRRVRITLVVDRVGLDADVAELTRPISDTDSIIPVERTDFAPGNDPVGRFVKIGNEWIRWSSRDDTSFTVAERGARGTKAASHSAADIVRAGTTLVREFDIPVYREVWND